MAKTFKRKVYTRGSSYETTLPMPMLFKLDLPEKKYYAVFHYDKQKDRWYVDFEEVEK